MRLYLEGGWNISMAMKARSVQANAGRRRPDNRSTVCSPPGSLTRGEGADGGGGGRGGGSGGGKEEEDDKKRG